VEGVREPAVAGSFYEATRERLLAQLKWCFEHPLGPGALEKRGELGTRASTGFIAPHAGYMYSGPVAAHVYYKLAQEKPPETIVLVGPNHTGMGAPISLAPWKAWRTPLGLVRVDTELRDLIIKKSKVIMPDYEAHIFEHCLEVQLPFIQYALGEEVKILPIVAFDQSLEAAIATAEELLALAEELGRDYVVIASTDFNHYEPHKITCEKDEKALRAIESLDPKEFYKVVTKENVSVCGPFAVAVLVHIHKKRSGKKPILLKHATSGDVSGDKRYTVGYASVEFPL